MFLDSGMRMHRVVKGHTRILDTVCIPLFFIYYTTGLPLGLNKLPLLGTKIVTLFGRWEKCFFFGKET